MKVLKAIINTLLIPEVFTIIGVTLFFSMFPIAAILNQWYPKQVQTFLWIFLIAMISFFIISIIVLFCYRVVIEYKKLGEKK
jgi:membrane protein implicated in regulation of membrane protease activity